MPFCVLSGLTSRPVGPRCQPLPIERATFGAAAQARQIEKFGPLFGGRRKLR